MDVFTPPQSLVLSGNIAENWKRFEQRFKLYLSATGKDEKSDELKVSLLLHVAGDDAIELYNTFQFGDSKPKLDDVLKKFQEHCIPKKNLTVERYNFNQITQKCDTFDKFLTRLKLQAKQCEFGTLCNDLIVDRIILGVDDDALRARLLHKDDLNLEKASEICRTAELVKRQTQVISGLDATTTDVHDISKKSTRPKEWRMHSQQDASTKCGRCASVHQPAQCPAYGRRCGKCGKWGHFAKCCRFTENPKWKVNCVHEEENELQFDEIDVIDGDLKDWTQTLLVNGEKVAFKLDTGAQANIIHESNVPDAMIHHSSTILRDYNGNRIPMRGKCKLPVEHKGKVIELPFFVVSEASKQPILGLEACELLQLLQRINTVNMDTGHVLTQFSDLFAGLGCLPGEHTIVIDKNVRPVVSACRKVPLALKEPLRAELQRMEELGVITKVNKPTQWVNAIVVVMKKNGKLRVCMDPRPLNKAIQRQHFKIPTREEIIAQFAGGMYFSKLDAAQGFWQLKLDDESSHLCTFITPFGRYRYLRLPFGISSAPEVYHKTISELFEGISGVSTVADDIIVWGSSKQEHDERLMQVLQRIREANLKLNREKCEFFQRELTFIGDRIGSDGVKVDPEKVKVIADMSQPTNKSELRSFLGMVNYLTKWIPNCAVKTAPLRELLHDNIEWVWQQPQDDAFKELKRMLISAPVLQFYDPQLPIRISSDASSFGIGFVLLQRHGNFWKPVAYGSRSMTEAEKKYAQIEKELLAITVACEHYHQFIFGTRFCVETDHQPLVSICAKALNDCPIRIQRLLLRLQKYDFDIAHTAGKHMYVADALSRCKTSDTATRSIEDDVEIYVNMVIESMPMSERRMRELQEESARDHEMTMLSALIADGWPERKSECEPCMQPYFNLRGELSCANGLVLRGSKIVVPGSLRAKFLEDVHQGHMGIEKCRRRARQCLYWPNMNADVEKLVVNCQHCIKYSASQSAEPLQPHDVPTRPFQKVGMDLGMLKTGKPFLVIIDYFSGYPEAMVMSSTTADAIIKVLKSTFARHGTPDVVMSDNGPQFVNRQFAEFARDWGFIHGTSSPRYPKSNGMAENAVKQVKHIIHKSMESGQDIYKSLLAYRNTPLQNGLSPAQMCMGRRLNEGLVMHPSLLSRDEYEMILDDKLNSRQKMKDDHDARNHVTDLPELDPGTPVHVQNPLTKEWDQTGVIQEKTGPRRYLIQTPNGSRERNRVHIKAPRRSSRTIRPPRRLIDEMD
jgi:transposase InsO family protein